MSDQLQGKLGDDKETLEKVIDDALVWMEDNPNLEKDDYDSKQKEVEQVANPILKKAYESINNDVEGGDGGGDNDDDDFMGEDIDGMGYEEDGSSVEEIE